MPILNALAEKEKEKGKGKERFFWNLPGFSGNDELKSPTTLSSSWFSRKEGKEKEWLSPSGGTASQPASVGRTGSALLKGGLLRKKESGDSARDKERDKDGDKEMERTMFNEEEREIKKGQQPHLWVATSSPSAVSSSTTVIESSKSPDPVKSPTYAPNRLVRRMRSDASILSLRAGDILSESSSPPRQKQKKGSMGKLLDSSIDFVDGL
jgi:hypothetical protein